MSVTIRVGTLNIPLDPAKLPDGPKRAKQAAKLVNGSNLGILMCQELDRGKDAKSHKYADQLLKELGSGWAVVKPTTSWNENYIFYRPKVVEFISRSNDTILTSPAGGRHATRAKFKQDGYTFTVVNTHLVNGASNGSSRETQGEQLAKILNDSTLLGGDFNQSALPKAVAKTHKTALKSAVASTNAGAGTYASWEAKKPSGKVLDHIAAPEDWTVNGYTVVDATKDAFIQPRISDHFLLITSLSPTKPKEPTVSKPMTATQVKSQMKKWGVDVDYQKGWETNKRPGSFAPVGIMIHHTGSKSQSQSFIDWLFFKDDAVLPAPRAQVMVMANGKVPIGAIGRANHAGKGTTETRDLVLNSAAPLDAEIKPDSSGTVDGNTLFYGNEVAFDGASPMAKAQYASTVRWAAAVCDFYGWNAGRIVGHGEWTSRKWDPGKTDMAKFRRDVNALLKKGPGGDPKPEPKPDPKPEPKPDPKPPTSSTLKRGSTGDRVKSLQSFLAKTFPGYRNWVTVQRGRIITVDGDFSAQTEAWVKEFQKRVKLTQDGIVGPATRAQLTKYGWKG